MLLISSTFERLKRRRPFTGALTLVPSLLALILSALVACPGPGIEDPPLTDAALVRTVSYPGAHLTLYLSSGVAPDGLFTVDPFHGVRPGVDVPTAEKRLGLRSVRSSATSSAYQFPLSDTLLQVRGPGTDNWVWESVPIAPGLPLASFFRHSLSARLELHSYDTIVLDGEYVVIIEQRKGLITKVIAF